MEGTARCHRLMSIDVGSFGATSPTNTFSVNLPRARFRYPCIFLGSRHVEAFDFLLRHPVILFFSSRTSSRRSRPDLRLAYRYAEVSLQASELSTTSVGRSPVIFPQVILDDLAMVSNSPTATQSGIRAEFHVVYVPLVPRVSCCVPGQSRRKAQLRDDYHLYLSTTSLACI